MAKPVIHFILPKDECFTTEPVYLGRAIYSPVGGLLAIAALTPEDQWDMLLTDENVETIDFDRKCDLAAISIMTVYAKRGYQIADEFRRKGVKVIMGGVHASCLPYEALTHSDAVVVGEAELAWERVLSDALEGRLNGVYSADRWFDMREMKTPRRELLKKDKYLVASFVQTSRGCPHECAFCCEKAINGNRYRFRPIDEVVREIEQLPDKEMGIYDLDVFSRPDRAYKLMEAMVPLQKRWQSGVSSRLAERDDLLEMARRSGCYLLSIGFESLSSRSLTDAHKSFNQPERYKALIKKIHSYGIMVFALAIFGFDSDDESVFEKTAKFFIDAGADDAGFSVLTLYPGSPIFNQLNAERRITSYDWSRYDQADIVFQPKMMSQETLRAGFGYAYQTFYSLRSTLQRFPLRGKRSRFLWAMTNGLMSRFERKGAQLNQVASDDSLFSPEYLSEHIRPGAPGMLHNGEQPDIKD